MDCRQIYRVQYAPTAKIVRAALPCARPPPSPEPTASPGLRARGAGSTAIGFERAAARRLLRGPAALGGGCLVVGRVSTSSAILARAFLRRGCCHWGGDRPWMMLCLPIATRVWGCCLQTRPWKLRNFYINTTYIISLDKVDTLDEYWRLREQCKCVTINT